MLKTKRKLIIKKKKEERAIKHITKTDSAKSKKESIYDSTNAN